MYKNDYTVASLFCIIPIIPIIPILNKSYIVFSNAKVIRICKASHKDI